MSEETKEKIEHGIIFIAIAFTLISEAVFAIILYKNFPEWHYRFALSLVSYPIVHPLVGAAWSGIICRLCNGIDATYEIGDDNKWGGWDKKTKILVASAWPIAGPIGLIVTSIGWIYGRIYKSKIFT